MPLWYRTLVGTTAAPGANFNTSGANTDNEVADVAVAPPAASSGYIAQISVAFGGNGAVVTARNVVWDSGGNLIAKSPQFQAPAAAGLQTQWPASPGVATQSASYFVGFWRAPAGASQWFVLGSGTFDFNTDLGADAGNFAATACGGAFICGAIQAYMLLVGAFPQRALHLADFAARAKRNGA